MSTRLRKWDNRTLSMLAKFTHGVWYSSHMGFIEPGWCYVFAEHWEFHTRGDKYFTTVIGCVCSTIITCWTDRAFYTYVAKFFTGCGCFFGLGLYLYRRGASHKTSWAYLVLWVAYSHH